MISLERMVELRGDAKLTKLLDDCTRHAVSLIGSRSTETLHGIIRGEHAAYDEARRMHEASTLAVYEEARRPLLEFLAELDRSAFLPSSRYIHQRLKELLK